MWKCVAIITCATAVLPRCSRYLSFLITICGQVLRLYVHTMAYRTGGGGGRLWNTEMASSAICVFICLTQSGGCLTLDGQNASIRPEVSICQIPAKAIFLILNMPFLNMTNSTVYGST